MSTYTQIIYQIVFSTKYREKTLTKEHHTELFKYIWAILKNKKCHLYQIGGIEDHLHIITNLHPSIALATLVKDIKLGCTSFIKEKNLFEHFNGWQSGYGAFTYSIKAKNNLIEYVKNQEAHHRNKTFKEELLELLQEHEVGYDDKYME